MFIYLSFFSFVYLLLAGAAKAVPNQARYLIGVLFIVLTLFSGLRGVVGSDTLSYLAFYDLFHDSNAVQMHIAKMEPLFVLFMALHVDVFDNKFVYILSVSLLQSLLLYWVYAGSGKKYLFLFCYVALFYLNFHFNITRAAIASMLLLLALASDNKKVKVLAALLAPGFHFSVLFFYPLFFLRLNLRFLVFSFLMSVVGAYLLLQNMEYFLSKYYSYQGYMESTTSGISVYSILMMLSVIFSVVFLRTVSSLFLMASIYLFVSLVLAEIFPIAYRLVGIAQLIYFYFLLEELSRGSYRVYYIFFWAPVLLTFVLQFYGVVKEPSRLEERIKIGEANEDALKSTYIPYQFYWNDNDI